MELDESPNRQREGVVEPSAEASSTFQFWRDLAHRFGFGEHFPWSTLEEVLDFRLSPSGKTFDQFVHDHYMHSPLPEFRKYEKMGFATPSGKVELASSVLAELGSTPCPTTGSHPLPPATTIPTRCSPECAEDSFFQTGQRNIPVLRRRTPRPSLFLHPADAARDGLADGDWGAT